MTTPNKALIFLKPVEAAPIVGEHLQVQDRPIDLSQPLDEGSLLLRNIYVSCDPYQRGRMRDPKIKSYFPPYAPNSIVKNSTISRVHRTANPAFPEGALVRVAGAGEFAEYTVLPAPIVSKAVERLSPPSGVDVKHYLGALGMPGLTAYSSFYGIAEPKKGETIFISSASGAVGAVVGQLAKHSGLRVIGSVGSAEKLEYITKELQFDGGFNYKEEDPAAALARLAPEGIDVYYENVGGTQLSAALDALKNHGRIVACGMISQYNKPADEKFGVRNLDRIVTKQIKMQGFLVSDEKWGPKWAEEHKRVVGGWISEGTFRASVHVMGGIEGSGEALVGMLEGRNFGKAVVQIAGDV